MTAFIGLRNMIAEADAARTLRTPASCNSILRDISGLDEGGVYAIELSTLRNCFAEGTGIYCEQSLTEKLEIWLIFLEKSRSVLQFVKEDVYYFYRDKMDM